MEVFSVFSSDDTLIKRLIEFFLNDETICLTSKDEDTIYLDGTDSARFYLHFDTSFEEETGINFEKKEEEFIQFFLKSDRIFMLDISYNDRALLYKLLMDFTKIIQSNDSKNANLLLFHDPFDRFVEINGVGAK